MAYPHEVDDSGVVITKNVNANNQAGDPEEAQAVTGRANDLGSVTNEPTVANSTFRDRAENRMVSGTEAQTKDLSSMTKAELQAEADRRGVEIPSGATKAEMVEALGG